MLESIQTRLDSRDGRKPAYVCLNIKINAKIGSCYYMRQLTNPLSLLFIQVAVLGNGTEYQHALQEDANPTGWCKMMSIFQPGVAQAEMVPLESQCLQQGKGFAQNKSM